MNDDYQQFMEDFDLETFIGHAIREILRRQDPIQFHTWLKNALPTYLPKELAHDMDQMQYNSMAWGLAYTIWNATPLPDQHFKPDPQPKPTRNAPCPCGSGVKFKQCCQKAISLFEIGPDDIWPVVLDYLPKQELQAAIKKRALPVEALLNLTENYVADNKPRKGIALLEPLFADNERKGDEKYEYALNMLCNLYDELNFNNKKLKLLHLIVENQSRCPLRSGAWQRLATIHMDTGDHSAAWEAFQHAHRDDPDSVWVGLLELQLLIAEKKLEQAKGRAEFWVRRLEKMGYRHDESPMDMFVNAALDPLSMMQDIGMEMTDGMGAGLLTWLQKVSKRPLPEYRVLDHPQEVEGDGEKSIEAHLRSLGFPEDEILNAVDHLKEESGHEEKEEEPDEFADDGLFLDPPEAISSLEQEWHQVFPLPKPLLTHDACFDAEDAWDFADEAAWTGFLQQHPEAFDSLDILDDLATALMQHEH
ncbi:MAG: SEC-C metal-binding domain-containing protein, partial [Gammaproteobacteria bacterium]